MNQESLTVFAIFNVKGHNRRIHVEVAHSKTGPAILITTRTLQGGWRGRKITSTQFVYGAESFLILADVFKIILDEPLFQRSLNPHRGQFKRAPCQIWVAKSLPKL